jgi:hypothetical protein
VQVHRSSAALAALVLALAGPLGSLHPAVAQGGEPASGWPLFRNVTVTAGLGSFLHAGWLGRPNQVNEPLFTEISGGGACWIDYDRDGWPDLYLVNNLYLTYPQNNEIYNPHSMMFHNNRDGTFTDVTQQTGTWTQEMSQGCSVADYDNDGWPDLYVTGWDGNVLFHNNGDGTFSNVTAAAGLRDDQCGAAKCWSTSSSWLDYNKDGCLDLYVDHWGDFDPAHPPKGNGPENVVPQLSRLYRNNCDGTFTDVTAQAGIADRYHHWASVAVDLNGDGWPDLYVGNDGDPNTVLLNNHDGTFTNVSGVALNDPRHAMGVAVADWNGDGRPDIADTNFVEEYNGVYLSGAGGVNGYTDVGSNDPLTDALPYSGWSVSGADVNNDGLPDLMVVNGMTENTDQEEPAVEPPLAYLGLGGGSFVAASSHLGPDFPTPIAGRGGAWADYDDDGAVDAIFCEAGQAPTHLFHNERVGGNFVSLDLVGTAANVSRDALGAKIVVHAAGLADQTQWKVSGTGFLSGSDLRLHFGLGTATSADVTVTWPDGSTQSWTALRANTFFQLTQGDATAAALRSLPVPTLTAPDTARRLALVPFGATADVADGASVASVAWDFDDGGNATGANVTHAFRDVGRFVVRATVTDTLGRSKVGSIPVFVTDDLVAHVQFDKATFLPAEALSGSVVVTYPDGTPVPGAAAAIQIAHSTGNAQADAVVHDLPRSARDALADGSVWANGTTDGSGTFRFVAPWSEPSPTTLADASVNVPGRYDATVVADRAGIDSPAARATADVVAELPPT